ncbi:MAG: ribonuclease D [Pseudomonadales bacterium]|jgi:ribonuclease D|nr:ribonuclease D [Pseudomonadales bacterium]MDP7145168.1 ribonuclease D [Pseudomonadales bacterium]MDP7358784.1 ribonuclease D [Pseudomonadales bacterium]MDP7594596.1 ribonuclease D [Pseudomonadales bacterium]HJN52480.1 ribonuclease D [Pseudomonadales bacterium]|tara:strand:- start:357 stop:1496 length:1140 start_codon:yes stop_codon:yes gene_type:complete
MNDPSHEIHYIQTDGDLRDSLELWQQHRLVALDTEFVRVNTYFPIAGLIQVSAGGQSYLVDPIAVQDLSPLAELCTNSAVLKILHACSEDLEIFQQLLNVVPEPMFDTQVAAAILGGSYSLGYQDLIKDALGVNIPKGETRSDWLQRPLTESQCHYAALDVSYLPQVYELQQRELSQMKRLAWVAEDCDRLVSQQRKQTKSDEYYLKVKSAWKLDRRQLLVLQTLCSWREEIAKKLNRPRNWIVAEQALVAIARERITDKTGLSSKADMTPRQIRNYGDQLLDLSREARLVPEHDCPELLERPAPRESGPMLRSLRELVNSKADELQIVPEVLAKKAQLQELLRSGSEAGDYNLPSALQGWRRDVIGQELLMEVHVHDR